MVAVMQESSYNALPESAAPKAIAREPLWLGVAFPELPLESFQASDLGAPRLVADGSAGSRRVLVANRSARQLGIRVGMPLSATYALGATAVLARDTRRERETMQRLAVAAGQFTSDIVVTESNGLLLEVAGSLRLYHGLNALCTAVQAHFRGLGFNPRLAVAPTPRAAEWLAESGRSLRITQSARLPGAMTGLPLTVLPLRDRQLQSLSGMGLKTIGDCMRLPRAGLARRLDPIIPHVLDQALGRVQDPRPRFRFPEHFSSRIELSDPLRHVEAMQFIAARQLTELKAYLQVRCQGVTELNWYFEHTDGNPSHLCLGLLELTSDRERLFDLLREQLERFQVRAPITAVTLHARGEAMEQSSQELFTSGARHASADPRALLERLRARLGDDAVSCLCLLDEHRPELAQGTVTPLSRHQPRQAASDMTRHRFKTRPIWLLQQPLPLATDAKGQPRLRGGSLKKLSGPERIETGWWDGGDVCRDYYVVKDPDGGRLWIYRDFAKAMSVGYDHQDVGEDTCWYLHGLFE